MSPEIIDVIVREREWSWSLIGLSVLILALMIRSFLLRNILHSMKVRNKSWYKRTLNIYQKRSLVGWVFFGLFMLGVILLWRFEPVFLKRYSFFEWFLIFVSLFFLSVFFHLKAYARSIVEAMQEHVALDKEL